MKTKKITQWIVFVVAALAVFAAAAVVLILLVPVLTPVMGSVASSVLITITGWGVGALWGYLLILSWIRLAELGWFV